LVAKSAGRASRSRSRPRPQDAHCFLFRGAREDHEAPVKIHAIGAKDRQG
jgi:hypothetical protein